MRSYRVWLTLFALIVFGKALPAYSQSNPVITSISMTPMLSWQTTNGFIYIVHGASTVTGAWNEIARFYSKTNSVQRWADTSGGMSNIGFYRIGLVTNNPANGFTEDFEDSSGWRDWGTGTWTNSGASGSWIAGPYSNYSTGYATSIVSHAHSGSRYIGAYQSKVNESTIYNGNFQLPVTDSPTQLMFWVRGAQQGTNGYAKVQYYDGYGWYDCLNYMVTNFTYVQKSVDLSFLGIPNPYQYLRFCLTLKSGADMSIYIDDVQLKCAQ
ncbi:MAG: hypothetical protein WCO51_12600 [bacterium]